MKTALKNTILQIVKTALSEDVGSGDITSNSLVPVDSTSSVKVICRDSGVIAGLPVAREVFRQTDSGSLFRARVKDGQFVTKNTVIADVRGSTRALLSAERTALNFLQRMSGIASRTNEYAQKVQGTSAVVLDTRKTCPGLRLLDKYAVACGGGVNHRTGLFDQVLIKENHLSALIEEGVDSPVVETVSRARKKAGKRVKVEIEVENLIELYEALQANPDIILLDNMSLIQMKRAVQIRNNRNPAVLLEASGNVNLRRIASIARTGVERISVGELTHSVQALDISMLWQDR